MAATRALFTLLLLALSATARAAGGPLDQPECIVPAKPGGGFELTCALVQQALADAHLVAQPMRLTFLPGGIGALAYNTVITQRADAGSTIVAFSGGSLINIAQGKFGRYGENDVRWLAGIGLDYGAVVVAQGSPWRSLQDLVAALKADPGKVVFGAGGTVGSQDWIKAALVARAAGVNPKSMRFVAFEGGGEAIKALQGGHIQVFTGDAAETQQQMRAGRGVRPLAVLADKRLPGALADVPTAREQGLPVDWPTVRGFYMGPKVSDADYRAWSDAFTRLAATPGFQALRAERGLYPFALAGPAFETFVKKQVDDYRRLVAEFGIVAGSPSLPR